VPARPAVRLGVTTATRPGTADEIVNHREARDRFR